MAECPNGYVLALAGDWFPCTLPLGHDGDHAYGARAPWPDEEPPPGEEDDEREVPEWSWRKRR